MNALPKKSLLFASLFCSGIVSAQADTVTATAHTLYSGIQNISVETFEENGETKYKLSGVTQYGMPLRHYKAVVKPMVAISVDTISLMTRRMDGFYD